MARIASRGLSSSPREVAFPMPSGASYGMRDGLRAGRVDGSRSFSWTGGSATPGAERWERGSLSDKLPVGRAAQDELANKDASSMLRG